MRTARRSAFEIAQDRAIEAANKITFRPIKLETVVVMRGEKVAGTIRRYRSHKACIVSVPGVLTASMAIGKGKACFPTIPAAKKAILAAIKS